VLATGEISLHTLSMSRFDKISFVLQVITLIAASYFAFAQNEVNERLARLEDYVSVSAVPEDGGIRLINTGGSNVYVHELNIDGDVTRYERPRQIAARSDDYSSYFVPISLETANKSEFSITARLTDEFGDAWISEHGGGAADDDPETGSFNIWTYQTIRKDAP